MLWKIVLVLLIQRDIGEMENFSLFLETHPSWKSYDLPFLNMRLFQAKFNVRYHRNCQILTRTFAKTMKGLKTWASEAS